MIDLKKLRQEHTAGSRCPRDVETPWDREVIDIIDICEKEAWEIQHLKKTARWGIDTIHNALRLLKEGKAIEAAGVLWKATDQDPVPRFSALEEDHNECHVTQAQLENEISALKAEKEALKAEKEALKAEKEADFTEWTKEFRAAMGAAGADILNAALKNERAERKKAEKNIAAEREAHAETRRLCIQNHTGGVDPQDGLMDVREQLAKARAEIEVLSETLRLMISYLGHQDQDANHLWMVKKMREALDGRHPGASIEEAMKELEKP